MCDEELGFSPVRCTGFKQSVVNKVLTTITRELSFQTSTPNSKSDVMDLSFPGCYKQVTQNFVDNDSGYNSRHQDSNSETSEIFMENFQYKPENCVYISEDALLEKPKSLTKEIPTDKVYQEFSHLYYLSNIIDESVSPVKSVFSGLQDSDSSLKSSQSSILSPKKPITVTSEKLEVLVSFDAKLKSPNVIKSEEELNCETSYHSDNSNIENNINISNSLDRSALQLKSNKSLTPSKTKKRKRSASKTPQKKYKNNIKAALSPDLFSDEEPQHCSIKYVETPIVPEKFITTSDKLLIKRVNRTLSGVLPPPSLTISKMSVDEMLEKIRENDRLFWDGACNVTTADKKRSLLINTDCGDCIKKPWPDILEDRYHGLHYNRSKLSEELETLYSKYTQRYIGAETKSSCTTFANQESPSKKKSNRLRWLVKSPGRRLSHLARRRITFSSANLQSNSSNIGSARQIMVDARRYDLLTRRGSPRKTKSPRKTPRKTPRRSPKKLMKTPSSSVKKRLEFRLRLQNDGEEPGPSNVLKASATKRALFQSPDKVSITASIPQIGSCTSTSSLSPWKKRNTHKRALFMSPSKSSCSENEAPRNNKRKHSESDDTMPCKLPRNMSMISNRFDNENAEVKTNVMSENNVLSQPYPKLSAIHKKKLQWAVYAALRTQNIGSSHTQYLQFASTLARVTRRLLPNKTSLPNTEGGTSERMFRIAKQHVFSVIKGKTVEEILSEVQKCRQKCPKPQGYIGLDEAVNRVDVSIARNAFQDRANTINSTEKSNIVQNENKLIKPSNKADRVRKIINFDDDSSLGSLRSSF